MEVDTDGDEKTWKSKTITDPLHQSPSRSKGRRSDIDTAVPVDDSSNCDVDSCNDEMAEPDDPKTESLIPHLGNDGEADSQLMSYEGSCTHVTHYVGVPAYARIKAEMADEASVNEGWPMTWNPVSQGPV